MKPQDASVAHFDTMPSRAEGDRRGGTWPRSNLLAALFICEGWPQTTCECLCLRFAIYLSIVPERQVELLRLASVASGLVKACTAPGVLDNPDNLPSPPSRSFLKASYCSRLTKGSSAPFRTNIFAFTDPGAGAGVLRPSEAWKPATASEVGAAARHVQHDRSAEAVANGADARRVHPAEECLASWVRAALNRACITFESFITRAR